jgi:hypothetical protein
LRRTVRSPASSGVGVSSRAADATGIRLHLATNQLW